MAKRRRKRKRFDFDIQTCIIAALTFVIAICGCYYMKSGDTKFKSHKAANSIAKVSKEEKIEKVELSKQSGESLDINSELIKGLYSRVVSSTPEYRYWIYNDYTGSYNIDTDVIIPKENNIIKMNMVGSLVDASKVEAVSCATRFAEIVDNDRSVCSANKRDKANNEEVGFKKQYIEEIYHELFGNDSVLDPSIPLHLGPNSGEVYHYVSVLDMYVKYYGTPNAVVAASYNSTIEKAIKKDNEVKIYETVVGADKVKHQYIYTFKIENDKYYFVSRTKKEA